MEYKLENYYNKLLNTYDDYRALGWETSQAQAKRFQIFLQNVKLSGKTLLDVGCGFGDLYGLIKSFNMPVQYMGIDILQEMVVRARRKYPQGLFIQENLFNKYTDDDVFPEKSFDVVFCSGIFNLKEKHGNNLLREALLIFKDIAKETIVFNLLSDKSEDKEDLYNYYKIQDIDNMLRLLKFNKEKIKFLEGYLSNDFTVLIDNR
jgi:ubiquinone/menaquinone biosynthesis C-methylase UbiE